ncbi:SLC13 family permease [bacterium]|nr:SLC13 family permease [bacterium]
MAISGRQDTFRKVALLLGPVLGLLTWWGMPEVDGSALVARTAGVAVWMAVWWLTEAVPLAVTSLLPLVFFPLLGILPSGKIASYYTNDIVFLFIGGFIVALAMERWMLHKRIALHVILTVGGGPIRTLFGFMLATALLSMWISNTATAMMMVPIAGAVLARWDKLYDAKQARFFAIALLLGIAYSASVGGMGTLVGTPPNLVFAQLFHQQFEGVAPVSFAEWFIFALPLSLIFLVIVWGVLTLMYMRGARVEAGAKDLFRSELKDLGRMSHEEKTVLVVFGLLALLWVFRTPLDTGWFTIPGWNMLLPEPSFAGDGTAAIALGILLFVLPAKGERGARIMDWQTARQLPWRIVLLFGGGFALAGAIKASGLASWIGVQMQGLSVLPPVLTTASISFLMTFLTELTSNTATTQMAMPILGALAVAIGRSPYFLMIPATLSASCAFMMPVATPPNAIVFGTGRLRIADMAKTGIALNLIGVVLITIYMHLIGPLHFSTQPLEQPESSQSELVQPDHR